MRLENKVAIITGGARGMGAAEAKLFAQEGAKVVIGDTLEDEGRRTEAEINEVGGECLFVPLDVASESDWERAIGATVQRFGKLDVLVNNAAIAVFVAPDEATVADWDRQMEINAKGVFLGTKAAIPEMRKAGGGSIVNISSISGIIGQANIHAAYNASKGAVRLLTKSTALQYAKEGIRVNSVHPGGTITPMTEAVQADPEFTLTNIPMGRRAQPEEIAYGVLFLASDESSYITGSELVIDGGFTAQ